MGGYAKELDDLRSRLRANEKHLGPDHVIPLDHVTAGGRASLTSADNGPQRHRRKLIAKLLN